MLDTIGTNTIMPVITRQHAHARICAFGKPDNFFVDFNKKFNNISFTSILGAMDAFGICSLHLARPGFNGICVPTDMPIWRRVKTLDGMKSLLIGGFADAVILEPGESAAWASADCHTITIANRATRRVAAVHGGRYALMPRRLRPDSRQIAPVQSDDDVIATLLRTTEWNPDDLTVFAGIGIGPDHFLHQLDDPTYGQTNQAMIAYAQTLEDTYGITCVQEPMNEGRLVISGLIRSLCLSHGIKHDAIHTDDIDTYADIRNWHSNRRGDAAKRNLVIVTNTAF